MQIQNFLIAACLLCLEAHALYGPDFRPSSPGFHRKRLRDSTGFRLPGTARPSNYDLTLNVTINDNEQRMDAEVIITLDVDDADKNGTYSVLLNSEIPFDNITADTFVWNDKISCDRGSYGPSYIEIKCPKTINGTDQKLRIRYSPRFADDMNGVYVIRYQENSSSKIMVATQFEQDSARRLMPCFDEPTYKATFTLTLNADTSPYNFTDCISNTKVVLTVADGSMISTTFATTPSMSTYLLAFVMTADFKLFTDQKFNSTYKYGVFARPSAEQYVGIAVNNGHKIIDLMSDFTGIPYAKLGDAQMTLAAIPEFAAGAMENWGLITFREQILVDEGIGWTTGRDTQYIIQVIAHEVTHQWFGDYVTTDWWSETWLNEGFAEFFEYYLADQISTDFKSMQQLILAEQQLSMKTDAYPDTIPLSNNASDVTTEDDFTNEFGDVSYAKGASMVNMIRQALGDKIFQAGLQTYLKNNNYSNPTSEILIDTLQKALPKNNPLDLKKVLNAWIYEAGYPVLDVYLDNENKLVSFRSTKFSSSLDKTAEDDTANWYIPLTYTTSVNSSFTDINFKWIDPANVTNVKVPIPAAEDSWIIVNLQSSGYYRVNYDEALWNRIISALNNATTFSAIDVINRAQLLDDAFNVARSYEGTVADLRWYYLRAFRLAEYLQYENEYMPWYTYFVEVQYLLERIQDFDALAALKAKVLETVSRQVDFPQTNSSHTETLRRNLLLTWACKLGHIGCVQWTRAQFQKYKNDTTSIDVNYRDVIVCNGLAYSYDVQNDFEFVFGALKRSNLPFEEKDLAKALACLKDVGLINQVLSSTINYDVPPFSRMFYDTILSGLISSGSEKVKIALDFVLNNHYAIASYWKAIESPEKALRKVAAQIYSQDYINVIQQYIQQNENDATQASMVNAAKDAVKTASGNLNWLGKYGDILTSVIVYNGGDPTTTSTTTQEPDAAEKISYSILIVTLLAALVNVLN